MIDRVFVRSPSCLYVDFPGDDLFIPTDCQSGNKDKQNYPKSVGIMLDVEQGEKVDAKPKKWVEHLPLG